MSDALDRLRVRSAVRDLQRDNLSLDDEEVLEVLGSAYDDGYYDFYYARGKKSGMGDDYERGYADAAALGQQRTSTSEAP